MEVRKAMQVIQLDNNEQEEIFAIVASLLHLGNVGFTEQDGTSMSNITNSYSVAIVSQVCMLIGGLTISIQLDNTYMLDTSGI